MFLIDTSVWIAVFRRGKTLRLIEDFEMFNHCVDLLDLCWGLPSGRLNIGNFDDGHRFFP